MEMSCEFRISIVIPVYQVEDYLDKCLQSVVQQTYTNLEIILVDDGSPDRCPEICDLWAKRDTRIRVVHQKNMGLSMARNVGISLASGDFLCFVDSDDYIDPETYRVAVDAYIQTGADIVVFNVNRVTEQGKLLERTEKIDREVLSRDAALKKLMTGEIHDYVPNKLFIRKIFDGIIFPERICFEDMAVMYRLFLKADAVCTIPDALYYYVTRKSSVIGSMSDKALCDLFHIRVERYAQMNVIDPEIADLAFPATIVSALRLYERSLWGNIDESNVQEALTYLRTHRHMAMERVNDKELKLYYICPMLYTPYRLLKHRVGTIVKWIRNRKR